MKISNTNPFQITNKTFSLPLIALITFFLLLLHKVNSSDFVDFTFDCFSSATQHNLTLQGDAKIDPSTNTLQLTTKGKKNSVGRALYNEPVHLWDKNLWPWQRHVRKIAMFETTFTFLISSPTREIAGDGFTLFFASPDTTIPPDSDGGFLGLFSNNTLKQNVGANNGWFGDQILAVEFDTYIDSKWDPNYRHIGININTIRSTAETKWERVNGSIATATIRYNFNNRKLYVSSSYPDGKEYFVSSSIDLSKVVPRVARVGFSASTGNTEVETHSILSWSFSSWLNDATVSKEEDTPNIARY